MFGRWLSAVRDDEPPSASSEVLGVVRAALPQADPETVRVVAAMAGLLAAVAYADRDYGAAEEASVREALAKVQGMTEAGVEALCTVLRKNVVSLAAIEVPRAARELRALGDEELRRDVLDLLVDLAAADGSITTPETNLLRHVTTALGLGQGDYNTSQERHRKRLSVLGR
jgi:uncharacterized tellurite resistance protein B-like protein